MAESSSPVSPDPWKEIPRRSTREIMLDANGEVRTDGIIVGKRAFGWNPSWMNAAEVDAARAADALRHQQFTDAVASALCVENPDGPVSEEAIIEAAHSTLAQLFDTVSKLSTAEATIQRLEARDAEWIEKYEMRSKLEKDNLERAEAAEDTIASLQTAELEANAIIASLTAERDKLKAGATTVTFGGADATIAQVVAERDDARAACMEWDRLHKQAIAERDAAQQENETLRNEVAAVAHQLQWNAGRLDALLSSPHPQEPQPRVPGCDDRLAPLQPTDAVVAIARPQEPQPMTMRPERNHWLFVDERGDEWSLTPTHDPSMPLVIICEKRAPASQEPGGHQP